MKLLTDFDGVLTWPVDEIARVREIFCDLWRTAISAKGGPQGDVRPEEWMRRALGAVRENTREHGWISQGRLSGFADEDGFIESVGVFFLLDAWTRKEPELAELAAFVRAAGHPDFKELGRVSFFAMTDETKKHEKPPIDPDVMRTFQLLDNRGVEIVVVSNSKTDRIESFFERSGIQHSRIRVRGFAQKYELGEKPEIFEIGGLRFDVSRPFYRKVLEEERPDIVIGDVVSFDLALPMYLAKNYPEEWGGLKILLREQPYTPEWAKDLFRAMKSRDRENHASLRTILRISELPREL